MDKVYLIGYVRDKESFAVRFKTPKDWEASVYIEKCDGQAVTISFFGGGNLTLEKAKVHRDLITEAIMLTNFMEHCQDSDWQLIQERVARESKEWDEYIFREDEE
jgi:hypothetical protein